MEGSREFWAISIDLATSPPNVNNTFVTIAKSGVLAP
jgi:hypothetical protein